MDIGSRLTRIIRADFCAHNLHNLCSSSKDTYAERRAFFTFEVSLVCSRQLITINFIDSGRLVAILPSSTYNQVLIIVDIGSHVGLSVLPKLGEDPLGRLFLSMHSPESPGSFQLCLC